MTVAEHLSSKTPTAIALYRALESAVRACGPIRVHATKTRIGFITRMTFAGAYLKKHSIDAGFILPYKSDSPRFHKVETFSPRSYGHYLSIRTVEEIDEQFRSWLRDAYEVGQQHHLDS
jgi:hypothetical protein